MAAACGSIVRPQSHNGGNIHGMRPSNKSRSRNKSSSNGSHNQRRSSMGNIVNRVFESAGPDGKVRGTPQQIIDKYQALARDAQVSGDRVAAESYLQHSEHYSRLLGEAQRQQMESRYNQEREDGQGPRDDGFGGGEQRRQPQQPAMAIAPSGLAMIDPEDSFDAGPVETPEGRRAPVEAPPAPVVPMQPAPAPQAAPNGGGRPERAPAPQPAEPQATAQPEPQAPEAADAPQPPKRTRSRTRRPKAEAPAPSQDEEGAAQAS
jgi:hypothetical protein